MKRRLFALALALLLAVSLPVSALARDWYIDEGDITIRATENGQTVSQGDTTEADDAPVIKQKDSSKSTSCNVTRSVSKMTEIERRGGKRWDKPKKAEKSRDCGGGKF